MKLTAEEQEILEAMMDSDWWPVVLKLAAIPVEAQRERISTTAVDKEADLFNLGMERKKWEGAYSVQIYLESLKRKKEKRNANNKDR